MAGVEERKFRNRIVSLTDADFSPTSPIDRLTEKQAQGDHYGI